MHEIYASSARLCLVGIVGGGVLLLIGAASILPSSSNWLYMNYDWTVGLECLT